ncbi:MAG: hypothetical protein ACXVEE_24330 [Polyangiales bacterium]
MRRYLLPWVVLGLTGCSGEADAPVDVDTGTLDSQAEGDSGGADSAELDSAMPEDTGADSSAADTSVTDSSAADTSTTDSGAADTSIMDSGAADTSTTDSSDSAPPDSTSVDSALDSGDGSAAKTATVWVMRLGSGAAVATDASAPLFIDPVTITYSATTGAGAVGTAIAIPSTGTNALSLAISNSIGSLSRSPDGKRVSFAAYRAPAGTAAIVASTPATIKRAAAAVTSTGTVTSLDLGPEANGAGFSLRGAITTNGTAFWSSSEDKGIGYTATAGTTTTIASANLRWPMIAGGQLYVTTGSAVATPGRGLLSVGSGLPTAPASLALVPGTDTSLSAANVSPYGAIAFDTDATAGIDKLYLCDDRDAPDGGMQRWRLGSTGTWSLEVTYGGFGGCRGVTAWIDGASTYIVFVSKGDPSYVVMVVEKGSASTISLMATAPANTTYRGIALAPVP